MDISKLYSKTPSEKKTNPLFLSPLFFLKQQYPKRTLINISK